MLLSVVIIHITLLMWCKTFTHCCRLRHSYDSNGVQSKRPFGECPLSVFPGFWQLFISRNVVNRVYNEGRSKKNLFILNSLYPHLSNVYKNETLQHTICWVLRNTCFIWQTGHTNFCMGIPLLIPQWKKDVLWITCAHYQYLGRLPCFSDHPHGLSNRYNLLFTLNLQFLSTHVLLEKPLRYHARILRVDWHFMYRDSVMLAIGS